MKSTTTSTFVRLVLAAVVLLAGLPVVWGTSLMVRADHGSDSAAVAPRALQVAAERERAETLRGLHESGNRFVRSVPVPGFLTAALALGFWGWGRRCRPADLPAGPCVHKFSANLSRAPPVSSHS